MDVFLSFSCQDTGAADQICEALEATGIQCWMAHRDIVPGRGYLGPVLEAAKIVGALLQGQSNNQYTGAISLGVPEKEIAMANVSKEALDKRANASFKKEERAKDAKVGAAAYEAEGRAVAAKTARLRGLRLAKEAADKVEQAAKSTKPARHKPATRPIH